MPSNDPEGASPPDGVFDRDQARAVLDETTRQHQESWDEYRDRLLDRLARCVRPAAIDRDALGKMLGQLRSDEVHGGVPWTDQEWADRVLALVRPVAGVTELKAEADHLRSAVRQWEDWSNEVAEALPEDYDGDEAQEDLILRFVQYAATGVTLTPEEAALAAEAVRLWVNGMPTPYPALTALAARLEASGE